MSTKRRRKQLCWPKPLRVEWCWVWSCSLFFCFSRKENEAIQKFERSQFFHEREQNEISFTKRILLVHLMKNEQWAICIFFLIYFQRSESWRLMLECLRDMNWVVTFLWLLLNCLLFLDSLGIPRLGFNSYLCWGLRERWLTSF